jgi:hypothetical protein
LFTHSTARFDRDGDSGFACVAHVKPLSTD